MRVLMYGWEFPPHNSGGLGVACQGLAQALLAEQIAVTFVLPRRVDVASSDMKFLFANIPRFSTKTIDSPLQPYVTSESYLDIFNGYRPSIYGSDLFAEVARYSVLAGELARDEEFDVIHAHDWLTFGAGIIAKQITGKPLVVHVHATEYDRTGGHGLNPFVFEVEKYGMQYADRVVAVSEYTRGKIIENYGIDPQKVSVVHNGIDAFSTEVAKEEHPSMTAIKALGNKVVLFMGRLTIQKGADFFIQAAHKVLQYDPNVLFVIAGSGDMEGQLMRMVSELGISDKVLFAGFLRGEEKAQMYKSADLFVMPSVSEPFGIVPLESMINGTPTIVSKQSGVSEVVSHALKVDFWDIDELANKMLAVLQHRPLHTELKQNGLRQAAQITWDKAADKLKSIYGNLNKFKLGT